MSANPFPISRQVAVHEECRNCFDLGVIRIRSLHDSFETLMLCDCEEGERQSYRLPRWEWKFGKLFERSRCPVEWFKPEMKIDPSGYQKLVETIQHKIDYWKAKVKIAEGYWQQEKKENETP